MTIDPARLARIRSRLLAAAAVTAVGAAGCGGPDHVNTPAPEPTGTGVAGPVNEPAPEPTATATPETPPDGPHVNTPPPDPSVLPHTINPVATAKPSPAPSTSVSPTAAPKDQPHVNRPKPDK